MGGALGLAVLASAATARTDDLVAAGNDRLSALVGGYHVAFLVGAAFAVLAATIGASLLRTRLAPAGHESGPVGDVAVADAQ
jgi:hypothetical protein